MIIILSSVSFWGYDKRRKEINLQKETTILVAKAEEVKEMAMSSQYFHGDLPKGGYGLYFINSDPNHYILFADCNDPPNAQYDVVGTPCSGFPELIERMDFSEGVYISGLSAPQINVTFKSPSPDVTINNGTVSEACITLGLRTHSAKQKTICFNKAGLIYVQ